MFFACVYYIQLLQQERVEQARQQQRQDEQPTTNTNTTTTANTTTTTTTAAATGAASGATAGRVTATTGLTSSIDNTSFFHTLAPELRRTILADMDDSVITHLPDEIASEARALRQERETRRRQILEQRHAVLERLFEQATTDHHMSPAAAYVNTSTWDPSAYRYAILNLNPHNAPGDGHHHHHFHHNLGRLGHGLYAHMPLGGSGGGPSSGRGAAEQTSKQMLDQEALTCLLVLLFFDQNKLHTNRLHRIVKNLSQHISTREWIISSLLEILHKASPSSGLHSTAPVGGVSHTCPLPPPLTTSPRQTSSGRRDVQAGGATVVQANPTASQTFSPSHWLNLTINAALGSHTHVFHFQPVGKVGSNPHIHVHSLASTHISNNVLDLLVFLARQFPSSFLPAELMPNDKTAAGNVVLPSTAPSSSESGSSKQQTNRVVSNFWHILLRLDGTANRKGKGSLKGFQFREPTSSFSAKEIFSHSTIGQLMTLLKESIVRQSISLTDKLLRVLSLASGPIPKTGMCRRATELPLPVSSSSSNTITNSRSAADTSRSAAATTPSSLLVPEPQGNRRSAGGGSTRTVTQSASSDDVFMMEEDVVEPSLLQIVVGVLTSGLCSEDGLDDATILLTNLSRCSVNTRENILIMLLDGIRTIGFTLSGQITVVIDDLNSNWDRLMSGRKGANFTEEPLATSVAGGLREPVISMGTSMTQNPATVTLGQQVNTIPGVVLPTGPDQQSVVDHSKDLHLPSMIPLTCKGSQQSFFLRMLKVVCQLRESAMAVLQGSQQKASGAGAGTGGGAGGTGGGGGTQRGGSITATATTSSGLSAVTEEERDPTVSQESSDTNQGVGEMEVDSSIDKSDEVKSKDPLHASSQSFILAPLSQQLQLDELWHALSECLDMLAKTSDPHAVLILQSTVEAFFLVHANTMEEGKSTKKSRGGVGSRSRSSVHLSLLRGGSESGEPASPAPRIDLSPVPSTPGLAKGEESYSHLPPDTARFLMFAGKSFSLLYISLSVSLLLLLLLFLPLSLCIPLPKLGQ